VRYSRYAYTQNTSLLGITGGCDPLLYSLIARCDPYKRHNDGGEENGSINSNDDDSETAVVDESEFEDSDGRVWRVTKRSTISVVAKCIYPRLNNTMHGSVKSFDLGLAKELIRQRLTGY
jgi:hypothetical protein